MKLLRTKYLGHDLDLVPLARFCIGMVAETLVSLWTDNRVCYSNDMTVQPS